MTPNAGSCINVPLMQPLRTPALWLTLFSAFFAPIRSHAQPEPPQSPPFIQIRRVEAAIRVDGRLDEPVWAELEPISGLIQTEPNEGQPASERTEIRLFYTANKLYFAFQCFDSEPEKIIGRYDAHDARTNSDSVNILLDPFGDRRTGYFFSINARGVQFDALVAEAGGTEGPSPTSNPWERMVDSSWDAVWESAARTEDWGWSAEVAIPFRSLRFALGTSTWGINLGRDIVRKNETANWVFVSRFDQLMRPSKAGELRGIADVRPGRNLEFIPFAVPRFRRSAPDPDAKREDFHAGVDIRWGVTPNLTVNATLNPDFGETEADIANIEISRFELFFPEKRTFFTEGATYFRTPMDLFFTRRIGERLPDGRPQRILFGGKLTGKLGPYTLGLLDALTDATRFKDPTTGNVLRSPGANFFVVRLQRDILEKSSLGFLSVNRDQAAGDLGAAERVHAVDLNVLHGQYETWASQIAVSRNPFATTGGIQRFAFTSAFRHNSDRWEYYGTGFFRGRSFDVSEIGFEPQTNRIGGVAGFTYKPFLGHHGIRQIFINWNHDQGNDTFGNIQESGSDFDLRVQLTNFWSLRGRLSYNRTRFNLFTADFQRLDATQVYPEPRVRFFFNTNENRPFWLALRYTWQKAVNFRDNYYGPRQQYEVELNARLAGRTRLTFEGEYNREFLLDGTPMQVRRLYVLRLAQQFTRRWRTRLLAQVSDDRLGRNWNVNSLIAYDFTARSAFFLGYNYQKATPGTLADLGHEVFIKLSYLFGF